MTTHLSSPFSGCKLRNSLLLLILGAASTLPAATFLWDGSGGSDRNWATAANWNPDTVPVSATDTIIQLAGTGVTSTMNTATFQLNRLEMKTSGSSELAHSVNGSGKLQFAGANATLYSDRNAGSDISNAIELSSDVTALVTTYSINLGGVISGSGTLIKTANAGGVNLTNSGNTFSGGIIYNGSSGDWNHFQITASNAMGTGLLQINGGTLVDWHATSRAQPGGIIFRNTTTHANVIKLLANSPIFAGQASSAADSTVNVTLTGAVDVGAYNLLLRGPGKGTIQNNITGTGGVTKMDLNTWTLAGVNSYQGATLVRKSALMNTSVLHSTLNVTGSITQTSGVIARDGGRLAGSGSITTAGGGSVLIEAGSILAPGNAATTGVGTLSITSSLAFQAGAFWELNVSGSSVSTLNLTGSITSTLSNVALTAGATMTTTANTPYWLLINDGSDALTGQFSNLIAGPSPGGLYSDATGYFNLGGNLFAAYLNADSTSATNIHFGGNDILLYAIPEPSRALLLCGAAAALLFVRRRKG